MEGSSVAVAQSVWTCAKEHWMVLVVVGLLIRFSYFRYFHPLARVPGPFFASITRLWLFRIATSGKQHMYYMDLHRKYGPVVRTAPNTVTITDPENMPQYFDFDKSEWWLSLRPGPHSVNHATELEQRPSKTKKKRVAAAYSMSAIMKLEPKVDPIIADLVQQLTDRFAQTDAVCNIAEWMAWVAFDVVAEVSFSSPPGFVKQGKDVNGLIASLHSALGIVRIFSVYPIIWKILHLPGTNGLLAPRPTDPTGMGYLQGVSRKMIAERHPSPSTDAEKPQYKPRSDILQSMIDHRDREGLALSEFDLEQEALAPVIAGPDTAATVLRVAILYVATNLRVLNELVTELDDAVASGALSRPVAQYDECRRLPYLDAVFHEVMRIYPVVGTPMPRTVPPEGVVFNGFFLAGGTEIGVPHWAVARRQDVYGDDVDVFRPERWFDADEETKRKRRLADVYFGQGNMKCTGVNVGILEVYKIIAELFLNFEFQVVDPVRPWRQESVTIWVIEDFLVKVKRRESTQSG